MTLPSRRRLPCYRLRLACLLALSSNAALLAVPRQGAASPAPVQFSAGFMRQAPGQPAEAGATALQNLASHGSLAPGEYRVQVTVNGDYLGPRTVLFDLGTRGNGLQPCLTMALLREAGLRETSLPEPLPAPEQCLDLAEQVPSARSTFDAGTLRLALSIPQIALRRDIAGAVAPERWDSGIPAAFVNYQVSTQTRHQRGRGNQTSHDLLLHSGLNLGAWRLRSSQALRENERGERRWSQTNTYVQRDLPDNRGNLTLGETFSNGEVFRSQPFKGLQLASDMGMLPDVMQNYAPVIRGVAQTRAKLEVLQNGYPIYSTYVAPGPYAIEDLAVGGNSGELEIVLTEADGQVRRFIQPYANLANLLREGVWRYSATLGRYNGAEHLDTPLLWQANLARGGSWNTTLYGGVQGGDYYRAATLGAARDIGHFGALAFDVTQARSDLGRNLGAVQGQSLAARYGKTFDTGTNLRFAGYRYSTQGYRDYDEAVRERNADSRYLGNRRSRVEASAQQRVGERSSLSLTLSQDDYWHTRLQRRQYQFQFNTHWRGVSYNFYASQALTERGKEDRQLGLNISLPLDYPHRTQASFDLQTIGGKHRQRAGLTGSALDSQLSYSVSATTDEQRQTSGAASMAYQHAYASYGAGYTQGNDYQALSLNASGSMLLHEGGLTLGNYLGETNALVHVPDTRDVGMHNAPAASTDRNGFMLVPHLRPYRTNRLLLDTDTLDPQVQIDNGSTQVVPRRGAIVQADFAARKVARLILTVLQPNGQPLPFGAQVSDADGKQLAVVGQAGQALIAVEDTPQNLLVQWGKQAERGCQLQVDPATLPTQQGYRVHTTQCLEMTASTEDSPL